MKSSILVKLFFISLFLSFQPNLVSADQLLINHQKSVKTHFLQDAQMIRDKFEGQLYTLPPYHAGHYGLRMYRQTLDNKYAMTIWSDMARVASRLNYFASEVHNPEQIKAYAQHRIEAYRDQNSARTQLRYQATKEMPEYLYLGVSLLGSMARANEYGLKHKEDKKLHEVIRRYDFTKYVTNEKMIQAWAAQLANQVYWLRQLGEQDVVDKFIRAFKKTYPDSDDDKLSDQQFMNKIYGLTHIIFAASNYYQLPIKEQDFQWIYDYYRHNIDTILVRTKEDVIAEVGISFLLAGLENDPVVLQTQKMIEQAIDHSQGLVPSTTGDTTLSSSEHRNVLAIMLLDWRGPHQAPTISKQPKIFSALPYGLVAK
ncbi:MAG: hypothetical protein ACJAZP_003439 [Psychromonas sp.]|jgi:hypothetical protein|uniref:DUF3541 domain-containing protein n=1 Tax=Psychromonas sp. TaxID=1884585 RepID=UPI0039E24C49